MAFQIGTFICKVAAIILLSVPCEGQHLKRFRRFNRLRVTGNETVIKDQWFIQKLDHFNGADSRTWKQVSPESGVRYCTFWYRSDTK